MIIDSFVDMSILFTGCIYNMGYITTAQRKNDFAKYFSILLKNIEILKEQVSNSILEIHVDDVLIHYPHKTFLFEDSKTISEKLENFENVRVIKHEYTGITNKQRINADQFLKCMRLNTLFEFTEDYCVVIDIHDNITRSLKLIKEYINKMNKNNKDYLITTWKSKDSDCPYNSSVQSVKNHKHLDAGLVIAKKKIPKNEESFEDFCSSKIFGSHISLSKGTEEMLMDMYLRDFYKGANIIFTNHKCHLDTNFYENDNKEYKVNSVPKDLKRQKRSIEVRKHNFKKIYNHYDGIYVCGQKKI